MVLSVRRREMGRPGITRIAKATKHKPNQQQTNRMHVIERPARNQNKKIEPGFSPKPAKRRKRRFVMDDPAPSPSPSPEPRTQDPNTCP